MDAADINMMLYRGLFGNYDYRLHNSFVYSWESDFFAMSAGGYCVEVEVKISRGDYFRDFEKEKHLLFRALLEKRSFYITRRETKGDEVCRFLNGTLANVYYGQERQWNWRYHETRHGKVGVWVNDGTNARISWEMKTVYAPATGITFHKVQNKKCPNQLYFACPKDLIKLSEIPAYSGLIYCSADGAEFVKRAPYLHKEKQDLTSVLLQKFYNLWQYKTNIQQKLELSRQIDIFHQSLIQ